MGLQLAKAFVTVGADNSNLPQDLNESRGMVEKEIQRINGMVAAGLGAIAAAGGGVIAQGLKQAAIGEQTQIAFGTLIGDAKETKETLEDLVDFTARTPFEWMGVKQAARGLITFGERGDQLLDTLRILGNAASGASANFGEIALIFNQVRGVGKLLTQDFRQLSQRGIISAQDFVDQGIAKTTAEFMKMKEEGKITFEMLREVMAGLSEEGGKFHAMMQKQSKTLIGRWSTFKDVLKTTVWELGKNFLPVAKGIEDVLLGSAQGLRAWTKENGRLAASIVASTTAVTSLTAAVYGLAVAARFAGLSFKQALIASGIGIVLVGLSAIVGALAEKFGLFEKLGDWAAKAADQIGTVKRVFQTIGILLNNLWQNTLPHLQEIWTGTMIILQDTLASLQNRFGGVIDAIGGALGKMTEWFKGAFNKVGEYLDIMLGSWKGFGAVMVQLWSQTVYSFQALWEYAKNSFFVTVERIKSSWYQTWTKMIEWLADYLYRYFDQIWDILIPPGGKFLAKQMGIDPDQIRKDMKSVTKEFTDLENERVVSRKKTQERLKQLEKDHQDKMAKIGKKSLEASRKFKEEVGDLPRFSDAIKEAWEATGKAVEKAKGKAEEPGKPKPGTKPGAGGAGGAEGFAGGPGRIGFSKYAQQIQESFLKRNDPQTKILKASKKTQDAMLASLKNIENKPSTTTLS